MFTSALPESYSGASYDRVKVAYEVIPSSATGGPFVVIDLPKGFHGGA